MSNKGKNEFKPQCNFYLKYLKDCPASKDVLQSKDYEKLMSHCLTKKYVSCEIHTALQERAA